MAGAATYRAWGELGITVCTYQRWIRGDGRTSWCRVLLAGPAAHASQGATQAELRAEAEPASEEPV